MAIQVPPLVYRIEKGAPVTPLEEDTNWKILKNFANGLAALFGLAFNDDGTLKSLPDRFVQQRNLAGNYAFYAQDTGAPNALAIAFVPPFLAYAPGMVFQIKLANPISGAATLNVDGLGVLPIKKQGTTDLSTGDGVVGQVIEVTHNGTNFQLVNTFSSGAVPFITGMVDNGAGVDNVTPLGAGDTQIGTHNLALPSGKTWTWIRHVFSTTLNSRSINAAGSDGSNTPMGLDQFKVKLGVDTMAWASNLSPIGYLIQALDDGGQITIITEGSPTGHENDAVLALSAFARQKTGYGDVPSSRKMYTVASFK